MPLVVIRRIILAVLALGMGGLLIELFLLDHYEDFNQQIPLVLLAAGLVALALQLVHPRRWTVLVIQLTMVLFIVAGLLGMYLHFSGSREFQLEMDPSMSGTALWWEVLRAKSPPTLSPGTMVQMGVLGLGYAYLLKASGSRF